MIVRALLLALALVLGQGAPQGALALTPEQATHVGGDLTTAGKKLAALGRIADAQSPRPFATHVQLMLLSVVLLAGAVFITRWLTRRFRTACLADPLHSRAASGLLALDLLDRAALSGMAYVLSQLWYTSGSTHDLLGIALLWSIVRWWLAMWLVEALLRPRLPQFRLVQMDTATAALIKRVAAVVLYVGVASISLLPLLLRAQMPLHSAQVVALVQGMVVALGGAIGLFAYHRHHLRVRLEGGTQALPPKLLQRLVFGLAALMVVALWLAWTIGVMALEFSIYHSLVWSLRIAAFALISGYAAWRYFNHWAELRLAAATRIGGPSEDDPELAPASRLTTVLPMVLSDA